MTNLVKKSIQVRSSYWKRLKSYSVNNDLSMYALINKIIEFWFKNKDKQ